MDDDPIPFENLLHDAILAAEDAAWEALPEPEKAKRRNIKRVAKEREELINMACVQTSMLEDLLRDDAPDLLQWPFDTMNKAVGPLRPGTVHVIGARPGNGKTTLLLNCLQGWVTEGRKVVYCGMEMSPAELRLQWAAWLTELDVVDVMNRRWGKLPPDARNRLRAVSAWMREEDVALSAIFPDQERFSMGDLQEWARRGKEQGADVLVIDHLHQMDWGGDGDNQTHAIAEGIAHIKGLARHYNMPIVCAAQLSRPERDVISDFLPPALESLRQSGAIEQVADVVYMLYRGMKAGATEGDFKLVRLGQKKVADIADHGTMMMRVAKHRLDGDQRGNVIPFYVNKGVLFEDRILRDKALFNQVVGNPQPPRLAP